MSLAESNIQNTFSISPFNEYYLPSVNRRMFESIDSKTQYNKKFKSDFAKEDMLQIIVGMDSGLLVNYLLEQGIPDGSIFIFIELNSVLSLLNIDIPKELIDKLYIYSWEEFQNNFSSTSNSIYILKNNFKHHRSLAATSSHLPEYSLLNTQVVKILEAEHLEQIRNSSQTKHFQQQFKNVSENMLPASLLANKFTDKTCLVIAGGPSLDDSIDWIRNNRQNLFIIAVSRIAGKLAREGITPHIIVSVDPYDFSFEVNRDMMALAGNCLFVNSYHVSSRLLGQWQGKSLFMDCKYPWQLENTHNINTLAPTVTNSSVHLATKMGFSRIILTGVDLCFTDDGFTHTKGSVESNIGPNLGIMGEWIDTYGGKRAETVSQLRIAMEALAEEASNNPQIEFINLSLNAAKIEGISYKNKKQLSLTPSECSPVQLLSQIPSLSLEERRQENLNSQKEFNRLIDTLTDIINLSDNASDLSKQLQNPLESPNEIQQKIDRIDKIDKKINQENSNVATLIKAYGFSEFAVFLTTKNTDDWDANHIHLMTINYYQAFKTVATQLLELARDTQIRLSHRLDELSPNANLQELAEFWREEQQHGRINIWLENHSGKETYQNLPSSSQLIKENGSLIKTISDEYAEQLAITPKEYIDTVKESASMENVFEKIVVLIRDNDHHGLLKMTRNLKTLAENDDEAKRLYHLTYCHQLQLEQKDSEALQTLLALDETLQSEVELKQISLLALKTNNIDVAEFALAQLSSYSDEYIPQHAHILKLQGKFQESVTAYLDYLDKYSEDVTTWLKLGLFMIEVNELESAKTAFQHALQTDPNNQVAQEYLAQL
ncbi:6-hydroxymethylpterin diphosphokinase MptE-like protein [Shewanella woodyi]|uniref:6-hydroxymethylpterin diphosphokinase MptE-like protein n=1 Tax=Shewanella woodyi TaxID=60961 RepID=UPI003748C9C2